MDLAVVGIALDAIPQLAKRVQPLFISAGETGNIPITVFHADAVTPYNLTACQLLFTAKDAFGNVLISRQATITSTALGTGYFPILIGDTLALLGVYKYDVWLTDATVTPNLRYQVVGSDTWTVGEGLGQPGQNPTVPPSQTPLAQGLPGNPRLVSTAVKTTAYTAAFNDGVLIDPTGGAIAVTLPLASTAINGATDHVRISNVSDAQGGSVTLQGGDLINGLNFYFVNAWESVTLLAYAAGRWKTV